jgi:hypothetical protein
MPVHVAGLETAEQEDLVAAEKEEVDSDWEFYMHGNRSGAGCKTGITNKFSQKFNLSQEL